MRNNVDFKTIEFDGPSWFEIPTMMSKKVYSQFEIPTLPQV
jgi:hypothetical protein